MDYTVIKELDWPQRFQPEDISLNIVKTLLISSYDKMAVSMYLAPAKRKPFLYDVVKALECASDFVNEMIAEIGGEDAEQGAARDDQPPA